MAEVEEVGIPRRLTGGIIQIQLIRYLGRACIDIRVFTRGGEPTGIGIRIPISLAEEFRQVFCAAMQDFDDLETLRGKTGGR